jgi:hypothetical protein
VYELGTGLLYSGPRLMHSGRLRFREQPVSEARFPRRTLLGSSVNRDNVHNSVSLSATYNVCRSWVF